VQVTFVNVRTDGSGDTSSLVPVLCSVWRDGGMTWKKDRRVWLQAAAGIVPVGAAGFRSPSGLGLAVQTRAARPNQAAGGAGGGAPPHAHAGLRSFGSSVEELILAAGLPPD